MRAINAAEAFVDPMNQRLDHKSTLRPHVGLCLILAPLLFFFFKWKARSSKDGYDQDNTQANQNASCEDQDNSNEEGKRIVNDIWRGDGPKQCQSSFQMHGPQMERNSNVDKGTNMKMEKKKRRETTTTAMRNMEGFLSGGGLGPPSNSAFCSAVSLTRTAILVWMVYCTTVGARSLK